MQTEGLGRHLGAFLKSAGTRKDVEFIIACPSWTKKSIMALCESEGINPNHFEIITPSSVSPILLGLYEAYRASQQYGRAFLRRLLDSSRKAKPRANRIRRHIAWLEKHLTGTRNPIVFLLLAAYALPLCILALPFIILAVGIKAAWSLRRILASSHPLNLYVRIRNRLSRSRYLAFTRRIIGPVLHNTSFNPKAFMAHLFNSMEEQEIQRLVKKINTKTNIQAWYTPAAFWPQFNDISAPGLMCVPDIVMTEFPTAFAQKGSEGLLHNFMATEKAIRGSKHIVTYSETTKWEALVDQYSINPDIIHVIHHAPHNLSSPLSTSNAVSANTSTDHSNILLKTALRKSTNPLHLINYANSNLRFIFYASQIRPSKNILTLLRAYEYLLRKRYVGHKLILTGDPDRTPEVESFIHSNNLHNDVLCLHGLTTPELAACYRLAELAVNPTLSEGGFPFTFSEALSVGTPVVMSRIPVTEETITEPQLQGMMLFNPYDWKNVAQKIEWALQNREALLQKQMPLYKKLKERTWDDVVSEHIHILERISTPERAQTPDTSETILLERRRAV
ncbi:MAG: glycosyltransferase [Alphaproteobacteria bacterium]|nr:glycosyltransferase [Alphaproteobacteria bacterium]